MSFTFKDQNIGENIKERRTSKVTVPRSVRRWREEHPNYFRDPNLKRR